MTSFKKALAILAVAAAASPSVATAQDITTLGRIPPPQHVITLSPVYDSRGQVETSGVDRSNYFNLRLNFRAGGYAASFRDGDVCGTTMNSQIQNRNQLVVRFDASQCTSGARFTADVVRCEIKLADAGAIRALGRVRPDVPILLCRYFDVASHRSDHFIMLPSN